MDVFSGTDTNVQRTNWYHGDIKISDLCEWLNKVPTEKIATADITGFPPTQTQKLKPVTNSNMLNSYILDIKAIAHILCNAMSIEYEND